MICSDNGSNTNYFNFSSTKMSKFSGILFENPRNVACQTYRWNQQVSLFIEVEYLTYSVFQ